MYVYICIYIYTHIYVKIPEDPHTVEFDPFGPNPHQPPPRHTQEHRCARHRRVIPYASGQAIYSSGPLSSE